MSLANTLAPFAIATPALLARRALLRRTDAKFLAPTARVPELVAGLAADYAVIAVPSGNLATYLNLYFDTPDLRSYHDHRRGRRIRHKVRIRRYPDRELAFLEVKSRRNNLFTDKRRLELPYATETLDDAARDFLAASCPYTAELAPVVRIDYSRIGLIGLATDERVTIDLGVEVDDLHGTIRTLDGVAIIEVKQPATLIRTPIMRVLRDAHLHPCSVSKYATATALTGRVRCNLLMPTLRALERIAS